MRYPQIAIVLVAVLLKDSWPVSGNLFSPFRSQGSEVTKNEAAESARLDEDGEYWNRWLQATISLSIPENPSASPSATPSASPRASPSTSPSAVQSASPSASPSARPSLSPSVSLPPASSASPNASPSATPSASPSASPSAAPTMSLDCVVEVNLECVNNDGIQCDEIVPVPVICEQRPSVLTMLYNGGPCGQSFNIQPSNLFQCFDLISPPGAGPPPLAGPAYIEARASANGELLFAGVVEAGDEFNITSPEGSDRIEADTSILIRQGTGSDGAPMQFINYHTSCSRNLFLKDRYGSTQVAGWINELQGEVNCTTNVLYNYDIRNAGIVNAELVSLLTFTDPPGETLNFTDQVQDQILEQNGSFMIQVQAEIDLTTRMRHFVEATLVGKNPTGRECSDTDSLEFEAGTPVFGLPPTPAPPTASPAPTPDPAGQLCVIEASAECLLANLAPCSLLSSLPLFFYTCRVPNILDLGWIFTGGTCSESTTSQVFDCTDVAPIVGPARIRVVGTTSNDEYFNGLITLDSDFAFQGINSTSLDPVVDVTITSLAGDVLQTMSINTVCTEANDLTLGETFGAFLFASYRNEQLLAQGFQEASWTYVAKNSGTIEVDISQFVATTNGVESGPESFPIILAPGEEFQFLVPTLLSLIEAGVTYTGSLVTSGTPGPCLASDDSSVTISRL